MLLRAYTMKRTRCCRVIEITWVNCQVKPANAIDAFSRILCVLSCSILHCSYFSTALRESTTLMYRNYWDNLWYNLKLASLRLCLSLVWICNYSHIIGDIAMVTRFKFHLDGAFYRWLRFFSRYASYASVNARRKRNLELETLLEDEEASGGLG